jgi:hypothetical protein
VIHLEPNIHGSTLTRLAHQRRIRGTVCDRTDGTIGLQWEGWDANPNMVLRTTEGLLQTGMLGFHPNLHPACIGHVFGDLHVLGPAQE